MNGEFAKKMGWRHYFRRTKEDREQAEEIDSYLQIETDENMARGMSGDDALAAARRKFGNSTAVREKVYDMNAVAVLDTLNRDLRYGLRLLRRNPAFAAAVLGTLAIGIGANTAVFSIVDNVLLKPLPYPDGDRLVALWQNAPGAEGLASVTGGLRLSASMYFTYAEQNRTLAAVGIWSADTANVTGLGIPEKLPTIFASDGALEALQVAPALGRWLGPEDQKPNGAATAMLGYGYWQRRFGGEPSVIGRHITLDSHSTEIVGVMPQGFRFVNADFDLLAPLAFDRAQLRLPGFGFEGVARLKPGVTIAQANADLARLVPVWMRSWPAAKGINPLIYEDWRITPALKPLKDAVVGNVANVLWVMMGTIGMVLLIAGANVANLLLVRAEARQQELSVRAALGAGWGRIVRELMLESMLLSFLGGGLGLGAAFATLRLVVSLGGGSLPRLNEISLDARALGFALAISVISGMGLGLLAGAKYARGRISLAARGATGTRERHRARGILVVAQVTLALTLLVASGLMIRTFDKLRRVQPGFTDPATVLTMRLFIPPSLAREPESVIRMQNEIRDRLAAIPGVKEAAFASALPLDGRNPNWDAIRAEGKADDGKELPALRTFKTASPGFLSALGTKLVAGRDFTWTDVYGRRNGVMVSENLARELWGSAAAAIGKRVRTELPGAPWFEVIGAVEDVRERGVQEAPPPIVYWPSYGTSKYTPETVEVTRAATFVVRSVEAGSASLLGQVQQAVWGVNANLPVASVQTMQEIYDRSMERTSFTMTMLAIAGGMALLLGLIGIYGVISYAVTERKREIGIRLALGAKAGQVSRMFVGYGLLLTGIGAACGAAVASLLTRLMAALLYGVNPLDPATFAAAAVALAITAGCAAYVPARRAAAVNPVETLRAE